MGAAAFMPCSWATSALHTVAPPPIEWPAIPICSKSTNLPHSVCFCARTCSIAASWFLASMPQVQMSHRGVETTTKPRLGKGEEERVCPVNSCSLK